MKSLFKSLVKPRLKSHVKTHMKSHVKIMTLTGGILALLSFGLRAAASSPDTSPHKPFHNHEPLVLQPPLKEMNRPNPYEIDSEIHSETPGEMHGESREQGRRESHSDAERAGRKLFQRECSSCHGQQAQGTKHAPRLAPPVLSQTPPGAIFWVLCNGSMRRGMPSFAHLAEPQRWQIVTYLKSLH